MFLSYLRFLMIWRFLVIIYDEKSTIFELPNWYRRILTMKKLDQKRKSQLTTFLSDSNPPLTRWIPARRPIKPVNKFSTCVQISHSIYVRKTSGEKSSPAVVWHFQKSDFYVDFGHWGARALFGDVPETGSIISSRQANHHFRYHRSRVDLCRPRGRQWTLNKTRVRERG